MSAFPSSAIGADDPDETPGAIARHLPRDRPRLDSVTFRGGRTAEFPDASVHASAS
ncbi:hypothetical protein [Nocardia sp. NPDC057227]|uniref:hypothetical protein n=1 Tax=Nocardia sp. NPDC057227 TaxID=3346056 RepID=UPI003625E826